MFADRDPQSRLCTGAFDYYRDGCPDTWGWVADLVNLGVCKPGEMLDPGNPMKGPEKWNDIIKASGSATANGKDGSDPERLAQGFCPNLTIDAADDAEQQANAAIAAAALLDKGYNTNYVASWYLVRSGLLLDVSSTATMSYTWSLKKNGASSAKGLGATTGPLTMTMLESSAIPTSNIPLLGCGGPGDPGEAVLLQNLVSAEAKVTYMQAGDRLTEAFCDGPSQLGTFSQPGDAIWIPEDDGTSVGLHQSVRRRKGRRLEHHLRGCQRPRRRLQERLLPARHPRLVCSPQRHVQHPDG